MEQYFKTQIKKTHMIKMLNLCCSFVQRDMKCTEWVCIREKKTSLNKVEAFISSYVDTCVTSVRCESYSDSSMRVFVEDIFPDIFLWHSARFLFIFLLFI